MASLRLHRGGRAGEYPVGDTSLFLVRRGAKWVLGYELPPWCVHHDSNYSWREKLTGCSFSTLREARDYLEALFAIEEPPRSTVLPSYRLRPAGPGKYEGVFQTGISFTVRRRDDGQWSVSWENCDGESVAVGLWDARRVLGRKEAFLMAEGEA